MTYGVFLAMSLLSGGWLLPATRGEWSLPARLALCVALSPFVVALQAVVLSALGLVFLANQGFFTQIGEELAASIEFVCSDMWKPYLQLIEQHYPRALNILDGFHIVAKMNKAIDEARL